MCRYHHALFGNTEARDTPRMMSSVRNRLCHRYDRRHRVTAGRWLMPCRFYEAGYYGVPCLAVHRFEVGNVIEKHRIGWTFDAPLEESLVRFFERLTEKDYEMIRTRLATVPPSMFVAGEDVAQLCEKLALPRPGLPPD